jgi:5'-deoxynucleotidase YfbR-like HD superfamily hydrolase
MQPLEHAHIEDLLRQLVLPFYYIERNNPLPGHDRRWENDAEHSWSLAFLACSLAHKVDKDLDIGKICQFATVHDIVEVYAGDTSMFRNESYVMTKEERESHALKKIAKEFSHFPWITETIHAYERKDCDEALFVYALDKYIAVAYDYMDEAKLFRDEKITLEQYNKLLEGHRKKAHSHRHVAKFYDEVRDLLDAHPEYFHQDIPAN